MGGVAKTIGGGLTGLEQDFFGNGMADAAENAAMSQQREARGQYKKFSGIVNEASVASLAQFDKALATQDRNLSRQEELIKNIDPAILEASQQALKLMRGETSSTLAPMQQQRQMQRQKLLNQLREQLGPGAETSSAGMMALNRFDSETSQLFGQAQQQALGNLAGVAGQFSQLRPDMGAGAMTLASLGANRYGMEQSRADALQRYAAPMLGTAGAQYAGDMVRAQHDQALKNAWLESSLQFGAAFGGMGMGGGGGGSSSSFIKSSPNSGGGGMQPGPQTAMPMRD